jgi:two-component system, NarL family, nitrate/nitrite response regulator NarL
VRRLRVLVAEDHERLRETLVELLDLAGLEVVGEAADGTDAVALAKELTPDAVLMDLSMPVLNGLDATRLLRDALPGTAVVMYSAFDSHELKRQALAAGAIAYLVKGCTFEQVRATLEGAVIMASVRFGHG